VPPPVWRLILAILLVAVVTLLWRYTRSTPIPALRVVAAADADSEARTATLDLIDVYAGTGMTTDNRIDPLLDSAFLHSIWRELRNARESITIQSYYTEGGAVTDTLIAILTGRVRAGVRVLLLLDGFGANNLRRRDWNALRGTGAEVTVLRPVTWSTLHHAANRSHVRSLVIDGRVGFTGGFGFADKWLGREGGGWRETNARAEGPVVRELQAAFAEAWSEATGELLTGPRFFPVVQRTGGASATILFSHPGLGRTAAERFLMLVASGTARRLYITNSYFVPSPELRAALERASLRGVDVRVLTAGPLTDVRSARYAGRYHYQELLDAGVRIYEYLPRMMHAKTLVADGELVAIGSMNLDNRSMAFNDELSLVVRDRPIGVVMDSVFFDDLSHAVEIPAAAFRRRSVTDRLLEMAAVLASRVL